MWCKPYAQGRLQGGRDGERNAKRGVTIGRLACSGKELGLLPKRTGGPLEQWHFTSGGWGAVDFFFSHTFACNFQSGHRPHGVHFWSRIWFRGHTLNRWKVAGMGQVW